MKHVVTRRARTKWKQFLTPLHAPEPVSQGGSGV